MKKLFASFLIALIFTGPGNILQSVEIVEGKLFLDVEIEPNAAQIHLKCPGKLKIQEKNSPFQLELSNADLIIEIPGKIEITPCWKVGITKCNSKKEAMSFLKRFSECSFEEVTKLDWTSESLRQINYFKIFLKKNYPTFEQAQNDKEADGWVEEKFSISNSEVFIYDESSGKDFFLNAPIQITSNTNITVLDVPKTNFWKPKYYVTRTYCGNLKIKINRIGKLNLISQVELEKYIAGVVPNEIGINVPIEALCAQQLQLVLKHCLKFSMECIRMMDLTYVQAFIARYIPD